jgi:putative ATPase
MVELFDYQAEQQKKQDAPLAARMRPISLHQFVGQLHLVGPGRVLRKAIEAGQIPSIILWGPPGSGKTTLAFVIARAVRARFISISAVSAGVADLRRIIEEAKQHYKLYQEKTIVFIDEIHRFNKGQQDAVLPYVEDGTITLIGATTENPSFEVVTPLLSRVQVLTLTPLAEDELQAIIMRAVHDELNGLGKLQVELPEDALIYLIMMSNRDARVALNTLEIAAQATLPDAEGKRRITLATMEDVIQHKAPHYDKVGEMHYNIISALHKSMRGSDPDASLYYLGRMLEAGEDPLYIVRRLIRFASEDVGMADPQALLVAVAAQQAVHFVGMPEANLALAEAVVYMATAPKSNSLYIAYTKVQEEIRKNPDEEVPLDIRNPVTPLMKEMGYGKDYKYPHDYEGHFVRQQYLPDAIKTKFFYSPTLQGNEREVAHRLQAWWHRINPAP